MKEAFDVTIAFDSPNYARLHIQANNASEADAIAREAIENDEIPQDLDWESHADCADPQTYRVVEGLTTRVTDEDNQS